MRRTRASRLHAAGPLLALLLVGIANLSCGKDAALLKPTPAAIGSSIPLGGPPTSSGLDFIPTEAVVTIAPGAVLEDFLSANKLEVVSTLAIPATGFGPAEVYHLVRSTQNKAIDPEKLSLDGRASSASRHNRVWMPEDDRGGLSFDDDDTWRLDGDYLSQPAIPKVKIPEARAITQGTGEIIAILDTGIDAQHPLFVSNSAQFKLTLNYTVWPPAPGVSESGNGVDEDQDGVADDGVGHGTHVAGIAFTGARKAAFLICKVLDDEGRGTAFGLAKAVKAAADYGAHVINLSLGLHVDDRMIKHIAQHCADKGIAVVASAGNRATNALQYPAAYEGVISVAAVDVQDVKPAFASFGTTVDIAAPGVDIVSPIPSYFGANKYAIASGSSMAAPFVSAAIALNHARWTATMRPIEAAAGVLSGAVDITAQNPVIPGQLGSGRVDFLRPLQITE